MIVAETYRQLITDRAHIEFELTLEALTFAAGFVFNLIFRPIRRHDEKHHSHDR